MPATPRPRRQPTDDWEQLCLLVSSPEQATYELLRPIVLFGQPGGQLSLVQRLRRGHTRSYIVGSRLRDR